MKNFVILFSGFIVQIIHNIKEASFELSDDVMVSFRVIINQHVI